MKQRFSPLQTLLLAALITNFLLWTLPLAFERMSGGRSGERQGQTAGMVRIYCEDSSRNFLQSPQVHYGNLPFNMEMSFFEWAQGQLASAIDGPQCNSVEPITKTVSVFFGTVGVLAAAFLALAIAGPFAGLLAAFFLSSNELWMRYSTYSMLDSRMISCGLLAIFFSIRRKPILGFIFWSLLLTQKPQSFAVFAPFWGVLELVLLSREGRKVSTLWKSPVHFKTLCSVAAAMGVGYSYYAYSTAINLKSDLPWVTWMGPRTHEWFFGNFSERFRFPFFKGLFLDWIRKTALIYAVGTALGVAGYAALRDARGFFPGEKTRTILKEVVCFSLPFLAGRFFYSFIFYNVYVVHEYYALPINAIGAVSAACTLGLLVKIFGGLEVASRNLRLGLSVFLLGICVVPMIKNMQAFREFKSNINNPTDWRYDAEWRVEVFPDAKPGELVAMAGTGGGRDILPLYFTRKHGFAWCAKNEKFAPRAFWKEQGVKWVAWWSHFDEASRLHKWTVRSIDEELSLARSNGWSSDTNDSWSGKAMSAGASFASSNGLDPCSGENQFNPQNWARK